MFYYFLIYPIFTNNKNLFFIFYFCINIFIIFTFLLIIYCLYKYSKNIFSLNFSITYLNYVLPLITETFFTPLIYCLWKLFHCKDGYNDVIKDIKCWDDIFFYIFFILGIISTILLIIMSYVHQSVYYDFSVSNNLKSKLIKTTSYPEVVFIYCKIALTIFFIAFDSSSNSQWIKLSVIFCTSLINYYFNNLNPRYANQLVMILHKFFSLFFLWIAFIILIEKIFIVCGIDFNGSLSLVIIGFFLMLIVIIINRNNTLKNSFQVIHTITDSRKYLNFIKEYENILGLSNIDRRSYILLRGHISLYEETCIIENCPLKKYLSYKNKGIDARIFLIEHLELVYKLGIKKFPYSFKLKLSYANFVFEFLNKKINALKILDELEKQNDYNLEKEFLLYRYHKKFEEEPSNADNFQKNNKVDILNEIEFINFFKNFKSLIHESTSLYANFWNELLLSHQNGLENISKLNTIGSKISLNVKEINFYFEKLQKLKPNNLEVISIYSDFCYDILNDKESIKDLKKIINDLEINNKENDTIFADKLDINSLSKQNKVQFIILSSEENKFSNIINISTEAAEIFGYTKEDLLGKKIDILLPNIFIKEHEKLLRAKLIEYNKNLYEGKNNINKFSSKTVKTFAKTKSNYNIPIIFYTLMMITENNEIIFFAAINKSKAYFHTHNEEIKSQICNVMTDNYLKIQGFTPNSVKYLNLSSYLLNSNIEITFCIKQLYEEYLNYLVENSNVTYDDKLKIKKYLIKQYLTKKVINWRKIKFDNYNNNNNNNINNNKDKDKKYYNNISSLNIQSLNNLKFESEEIFYLQVEYFKINNVIVGYNFLLETTNDISLDNKFTLKNNSIKRIRTTKTKENKNDEECYQNVYSPKVGKSRKSHFVHIGNNFIPKTKFNFKFNINKISYYGNEEESKDLAEIIKEKVLQKFSDNDNDKEIESKNNSSYDNFSSDYEEVEDDEYESSSENKKLKENDNNDDNNDKKENNKNNNLNVQNGELNQTRKDSKYIKSFLKTSTLNKNIIQKDDYYHVNLKCIIFQKYDYKNNNFIDIKNYEKISQIDYKLRDISKNKKDDKKVNFSENKLHIATKKLKKSGGGYKFKTEEEKLIKEIEIALHKQESHESFINLLKGSLLNFIILILIGIFLLFFILYLCDMLNEISILINYSYRLLLLSNINTYYVKELILLNNENYTNVPSKLTIDEYKTSVYKTIYDSFNKTHKMIIKLISTTLKISKKNFNIINNTFISIENLGLNKNIINNLTTKMQDAFIDLNTGLFQTISRDTIEIYSLNTDTFYFVRNSLNYMEEPLRLQAYAFLDELFIKVKHIRLYLLIIFCVIFIIFVSLYFLFISLYEKVAKKKESYIELFFQINLNIIKSSLEKCEVFNCKLQKSENEIEDYSLEDLDDNNFVNEKIQNDTKMKARKNSSNKEVKNFKLRVSLILFAFFCYILIIIIYFLLFISKLKLFHQFFHHELLIENQFYIIFNDFREFLFDINALVRKKSALENLNFDLNNIYNRRQESQYYMDTHRTKLPMGYKDKITEFYSKSPCHFMLNDYFTDEEECLKFMNGVSKNGFKLMCNYFIEEIREAKNYYSHYLNENMTFPNLTLVGTDEWNKSWPLDENEKKIFAKLNPINYFNENYHHNLNVMYRNNIRRYFFELKNIIIDCISEYIKKIKTDLIFLLIIYFLVNALFFFFAWIPFLYQLNSVIYKTKNMLNIIPKEVLASLRNIKKVLDIHQNTINENKKNKNNIIENNKKNKHNKNSKNENIHKSIIEINDK